MTRLLFFAALIVAPLLVGVVGGAATAVIRGRGDADVRVDVVNESGQRLKSFVLDMDACDGRSMPGRAAPEPGDRATVRLAVCGEGTCELRAQLENGVQLHGRSGTIEGGYREPERMRRSQIVPAVPAPSERWGDRWATGPRPGRSRPGGWPTCVSRRMPWRSAIPSAVPGPGRWPALRTTLRPGAKGRT